ncbi:unnamed protein product [Lota lota]
MAECAYEIHRGPLYTVYMGPSMAQRHVVLTHCQVGPVTDRATEHWFGIIAPLTRANGNANANLGTTGCQVCITPQHAHIRLPPIPHHDSTKSKFSPPSILNPAPSPPASRASLLPTLTQRPDTGPWVYYSALCSVQGRFPGGCNRRSFNYKPQWCR